MSIRELNGWSPAVVTVDSAGEVVSVTVQEPRFSRSDVDLLLASRRRQAEPMSASGLPLSVATDPANKGAFSVPLPVEDYALKTLNDEKAAYRKKYPDSDLSHLLWRVEKA